MGDPIQELKKNPQLEATPPPAVCRDPPAHRRPGHAQEGLSNRTVSPTERIKPRLLSRLQSGCLGAGEGALGWGRVPRLAGAGGVCDSTRRSPVTQARAGGQACIFSEAELLWGPPPPRHPPRGLGTEPWGVAGAARAGQRVPPPTCTQVTRAHSPAGPRWGPRPPERPVADSPEPGGGAESPVPGRCAWIWRRQAPCHLRDAPWED